ncbi:hypothetical protein HMPREF1210_01475 [Paenisporosarcina sp. HGH0030]|nr:hypothetical protein HMPREF1210_01475 [Paenisporosarcina sp. HGH0030]
MVLRLSNLLRSGNVEFGKLREYDVKRHLKWDDAFLSRLKIFAHYLIFIWSVQNIEVMC